MKSVHILITFALGLACSMAEAAADWRLELLKEKGLSSDTQALEAFRKGTAVSGENLNKAVARLASSAFTEREQAQKEILLMGAAALPMLREMPESDDPEVRMRLGKIMRTLSNVGRETKDDLLLRAVSSLLHERKNPGAPDPAGRIFVEFFSKPQGSLEEGYGRLSYEADGAMKGSVSDGGFARMEGMRDGDGDQRLLLGAKAFTGKEEFPNQFHVSAKLGGGGMGAGAYHVGISVGNVRVLFHPGYPGGALRLERVDDNVSIVDNKNMGFDPEPDKLLSMRIDVKRIGGGLVILDALVTSGDDSYRTSKTVTADAIGKLDQIGLDRSGRTGGDGLFDDFVVDLGKQ